MARGPVPNRSEDLARPRERKGKDVLPVTKGTLRPVVDIPAPDEEWHPIAQNLYLSLAASGQSDWYQESDWWFAYSLCEDLSYYKNNKSGKGRSGQMLQTIYAAMERLLVAEGDRRRVRIELSEPEVNEDDATLTVLEDYKAALGM